MSPENHLSSQDLLQVLSDGDAVELEQRVEDHVTDCDMCRGKLESLAASPELWQKASHILTENQPGETVLFSSRIRHRETDFDIVEKVEGYSVKKMLDRPTHPEMLGRLGHYEIEREVGRGGMGVVLKAHDTELNRAVAIKMMAPHLASHGIARQRFAREARSAAAILHPNVIAIHGVSTDSTTPWLVMPYIVGPSLEQIVQGEGALDERDLVSFAMQIASGLAAAHSQGVVHRDIKPANVLIESGMGRVVITDFGLARAECDASMTQTGWFAGTPNFMSPEQARGQDVDHRSDLFSLGSVMYYMATGRLPFRAEGPMAVLEQIRDHHPASARSANARISTTISNLIACLLTKQPEDRIQSASAVQQVLEQYLAHLHHPATRDRPVVKPPKPTHGNRFGLLTWSASIGAVALIAILLWVVFGKTSDPQNVTFESIIAKHHLQKPDEFQGQLQALNADLDALEKAMGSNDWFPAQANEGDSLLNDLQQLDRQLQIPDGWNDW